MSRSRWLNILAIGLIVLIIGTFAAIAIPGVMQDQSATATPDGSPTPPPSVSAEVPYSASQPQLIELPVQIGNVTLTADLTDAEALASAMPRDTMGAFSIPTPMYGGATYIMSVDEARVALGGDPLLPTTMPVTHTMNQWYGFDGAVTITYTTEAFEHSLVINEQRPTSNTQSYAVGSAPIYSTVVHGLFAVYLEQAPLGWIPPMLSGFDASQGGWVQATADPPTSGAVWPFNALIWEENGLVIRVMSSSMSFDELLAVAESMRPNGLPDPTTIDGTGTPTPLPTPSLGTYFFPEVPINVTLPDQYTYTSMNEGWIGSIASGYLHPPDTNSSPALGLMQFYSYDSIKQNMTNCPAGTSCYNSAAPTTESYITEYEAFMNGTQLTDAETKTLGAHTYFVQPCVNDDRVCFVYTTFIGETKVDILATMESNSQINLADALIAQIVFDQKNAFPPTPAPTPTVQTANLGETITTTPMQQINIAGQDLFMVITQINDSRCLPNVECVQAGSVSVTIDVTLQGETSTINMILEAGATPETAIVGGYEISLISVETHRDPPDGPPTGYTILLQVDQILTN